MRPPNLRPIHSAFTPATFVRHHPSPCCQPLRRLYATPPRTDDHVARLRSEIASFHHASVRPRLDAYRKSVTAHTSNVVTSLARHATVLGLKMNEVTGYQEVEKLKALVTAQGEPNLLDSMMLSHSQSEFWIVRDTPLDKPRSPMTKLYPTAQMLSETSIRCWSASTRGPTPMS